MSSRVQEIRPPYPLYQATPIFGGDLPSIDQFGPPDLRPSSMNPSLSVFSANWGRNFAGLGQEKMNTQTSSADEGIADYPNELSVLAEADDVSGNGVFDPHGSPGNIHPDYGVFTDQESLPGYIVRDQFYAPSEVIDGTTGRPVMYVPSGAVAIDQAQADTYRARQLLTELQPHISPETFGAPDFGDTWIPKDYAMPVAGLGQDEARSSGRVGMFAAFAVVGLGLGIAAAVVVKRKRGR